MIGGDDRCSKQKAIGTGSGDVYCMLPYLFLTFLLLFMLLHSNIYISLTREGLSNGPENVTSQSAFIMNDGIFCQI